MKKLVFVFLGVLLLLACEEIINEENIENDSVTILAPSANSTLKTNTEISYHWQTISGASDYELQIASPNFQQATKIVLDSVMMGTFFSVDSLKAGNYEWRVRALNSAFASPYTTNSFSVEP